MASPRPGIRRDAWILCIDEPCPPLRGAHATRGGRPMLNRCRTDHAEPGLNSSRPVQSPAPGLGAVAPYFLAVSDCVPSYAHSDALYSSEYEGAECGHRQGHPSCVCD